MSGSISILAIDQSSSAKFFGYGKALIIQIDHDDQCRREKLCGQKNGEPYRPCTNDGDSVPGFNVSVQHAEFKTCWKNVAEHDQVFFISLLREMIKATVSLRDAHILSLCSVDRVAEYPSSTAAVGIHVPFAEIAFQACCDTGDDDFVSYIEFR